MTIRARLALSYGIAMIVMTLFIVGIVWLQVGSTLRASLDEVLRTRATAAARTIEDEEQLGEQGDVPRRTTDTFFMLLDQSGKVLDASSNTPPALLTWGRPLTRGDVTSDSTRYAIEVVRDTEDDLFIVAGGSLSTIDTTVNDVTRVLALVGGVAVMMSLLAGWWLAGRALRPIAMLTDEAALIGATDLDARLPVPPVRDELGILAETLNAMIERLADGLRRERAFIAGASHQLRTPLAALRAELELATDEHVDAREMRVAIADALADTIRLGELTTGLIALAAAEADGREVLRAPVQIGELIGSALRQVESRARQRRVTITTELAVGEVRVDRLRLEQAVVNLLVNAIAYGPEGGTVEIVTSLDPDQDSGGAHGVLVIQVLDRGPGIPDHLVSRIFEPFQRGPNRHVEGAGLGLATAAAAVRAHHGVITVESREGGGSRFAIQVPR